MVQQNISLLFVLSHSDCSLMGLKKCLVYRIFRGSSIFFFKNQISKILYPEIKVTILIVSWTKIR